MKRTDEWYPYGSNQRSMSLSVPSLSMAKSRWLGKTVKTEVTVKQQLLQGLPSLQSVAS